MKSEEQLNTIMFVSGRKPDTIVERELRLRGLNVEWANSIKAAKDLLALTIKEETRTTDSPDGSSGGRGSFSELGPRPAACAASKRTGIVTDLALPDGNWRDLVERVRAVSNSIPIVVVSPSSTAELWWDALDCDVEDILSAPLSASRLCEVLGTGSKGTA